MRILILTDDFPPTSFGGAGIVAFNQARELAKMGHKVSVVTTTQNKNEEGVSVINGLEVSRIYANYQERYRAYFSLYNPQTVSRIRKILNEKKPDVVHAHNIHYYLSYHTLKTAKEVCNRVVFTAHDTLLYSYGKVKDESHLSWRKEFKTYRFRFNLFRNIIIRRYLGYVDCVVAVSESLARALNNNGITDVSVIHNGIDANAWTSNRELQDEFKTKYGLKDKKVILFSGRLSPAKGAMVTVRALLEIICKIPNAILLVVGQKNKASQAMLDMAIGSGASGNIVFTGWLDREKIKLAYFCSDIVVVPSIYLDPFPTVNLEAMASKKPIVGTCWGGTSEAVLDGFNGYIVDPNNADVLAEKILDLLKNPEKSKKFGANGFTKVGQDFSLAKQVDKYLSLYR
ncbi:MAG: hypothetical protein A3A08_01765 [Candidatus Nealsonbacteria bacterium RIFCSPLOWO2_01_FULL_41_9]|uniref:Glycosyltransferase subfamily 4-like N-terminal domain-containing protein n=1 Tax=Candidatus Nealsonbacteria bacterium RIFCSPLOWO2_01_FULL_41_9 TaxID=1801671 RepID=A0A1G2EA39_9BACT|nr:MAG: hypothetical protein A3A08_01765 [Candidatus Nealsonbacteria bacterium RIFCSPLOWO2_01_FULL_41_9]